MRTTSNGPGENTNQSRHGLKYLSREKQPSMFDILSWQHDPLKSKDWLTKMQPNYRESKITEHQMYEKPQKHATSPEKYGNQIVQTEKKHQLKAHQIKHELYDYGDEKISPVKNKRSKEGKKCENKDHLKKKQKQTKLDQFNDVDQREIDLRKKNIKEFKLHTRELPDSAFTTYFGKPTFAHYGSGSKGQLISKHKSHSVMPHAGKNQPQFVQSYAGALDKANVINIESRIPKKPIHCKPVENCEVKVSEYYNVEIVKPELINQANFSNEDHALKLRPKTPSHKDLNYLPKRKYASPLHVGSKNRKKKTNQIKN